MKVNKNLLAQYKRLLSFYERGHMTDKEKDGLINLGRVLIDQFQRHEMVMKKVGWNENLNK